MRVNGEVDGATLERLKSGVELDDGPARFLTIAPAGGEVQLAVTEDAGSWRVAVSDTGPGLAADEQERVFDRFYRGRDSKAPGSGLGLAIVREVARLHGGETFIGAGPGGRGLTVGLRLPAARP